MRSYPKPSIVISKCLGFDACRWNAAMLHDEFVERLKARVDFQPVCAEVEMGLGVPRDPVRLVRSDGGVRLFQPGKERDVTEEMVRFANGFLDSLGNVDGFLLKSRSPSCGIKDTKVYPSPGKVASVGKSAGMFGNLVLERFPFHPVEDEGRLMNDRIRENYLTRVFAIASFRLSRSNGSINDLVRFHSDNKLLLMAYSQKELRNMGRIVANKERRGAPELFEEYSHQLKLALARMPRYTSVVNVLQHSLGYFSKNLSAEERKYFLDLLERYKSNIISVQPVISVLRSWCIRFGEEYLSRQTFLDPYPEELFGRIDKGEAREISR
jgi:uncharacterized protein YbgA (DUF1722 family)/uncharacterized protein YbbK (DUF523 family)